MAMTVAGHWLTDRAFQTGLRGLPTTVNIVVVTERGVVGGLAGVRAEVRSDGMWWVCPDRPIPLEHAATGMESITWMFVFDEQGEGILRLDGQRIIGTTAPGAAEVDVAPWGAVGVSV